MSFFNLDKSSFKEHNLLLRKGSLASNYVIEKIDNGEYAQVLKRLLKYMSVNPQSNKSLDYSGKEVIQGDLKDSLLISSSEGNIKEYGEGKIKEKTKPFLYNSMFNQEMKIIDQCFIFVHNFKNKIVKNSMGIVMVQIDIIIPEKYDNIFDNDSKLYIKRGQAISILIDDLINKKIEPKDELYSKYLGNLNFTLLNYETLRLSKTSDGNVYSLLYGMDVPVMDIPNNMI